MNSNQKSLLGFIFLSPILVPYGFAKMQWQKWFPPKVTATQKTINAKLDAEDKAAREYQEKNSEINRP